MLVPRFLLFLFGASISSAHLLRNGKPWVYASEPELLSQRMPAVQPIPSTPGLPFISHFLQQGSNLFYKPQIILPTTLPSLVPIEPKHKKKDCKKHKEVIIERPVLIPEAPTIILDTPIEEVMDTKPLFPIPQAPQLPPLIMPEIPATVVVEEPLPPAPFPIIPEAPIVEVQEHIYKPIEIPTAPELPPFVMPEIPSMVIVEEPLPPAPFPIIPEAPIVEVLEYVYKPIEIPTAPELPPFVMPEIPSVVIVEDEHKNPIPCHHGIYEDHLGFIPIAPELPAPVFLPEAPKEPEIIIPIANIPDAPQLPPFTMPEIPALVFEEPGLPSFISPEPLVIAEPSLPCPPAVISEAPVIEVHEYEPFVIPQAPHLPHLPLPAPIEVPTVPEGPILVQEPVQVSEFRPIPAAPELPPIVMPMNTEPIFVEPAFAIADESCEDDEPEAVIQSIPPSPVFPPLSFPFSEALSFPTYCAQNIILQRVLPNIIINDNSFARKL